MATKSDAQDQATARPIPKLLLPIPKRLLERVYGWPRPVIVACGALMLIGVWAVDRLTGIETGLSVFYLVPISFVVWFVGPRANLLMSIAAAGAWLWADVHGGRLYARPRMPYLNAGVHLWFFIIFSELLLRVKAAYRLQEEVSRLKSEMMSLVSHEFNNGLTTLKLTTLLLKGHADAAGQETRKNCCAILERLGQRLTMTVENFLKLSRLESGHLRLDLKPTPIQALVQETIDLLEPLAVEKKIRLELDMPHELIPARADSNALALVMSNLIGNAIKYTPAGGRVVVSMKREEGAEGQICVCVADTGIGIRPEDQEKILQGHFRTEGGAAISTGHGIGLMVSREVLESHGAVLQVESEVGKGARFFFTLPAWRPAA
jgi:signal transduction histidine kinase